MPARIPDTLKDRRIGQACIDSDGSDALQVRLKTTRPGAFFILATPIFADDFSLADNALLQVSARWGEQFGPERRNRISILQPHPKLKRRDGRMHFQIPNIAST